MPWLDGNEISNLSQSPFHDIILHVRMLDSDNQLQQEAIGIMGVNLVYGAMHLSSDPDAFITSLADNLGTERIEVDMIELMDLISNQLIIEFFA